MGFPSLLDAIRDDTKYEREELARAVKSFVHEIFQMHSRNSDNGIVRMIDIQRPGCLMLKDLTFKVSASFTAWVLCLYDGVHRRWRLFAHEEHGFAMLCVVVV
jgi:hypothetical protein